MIREWGCPKCGEQRSSIDDTAWDDDGYCVRLRRCVECLTYWDTEEVPIARGAFYARAHSRKTAQLAAAHRRTRQCCFCGVIYHYGSYSRHIETAEHIAALNPVSRQRRTALRRNSRAWCQRRSVA